MWKEFFAFVAPYTSHVALCGLVKLVRVWSLFLLEYFMNIPGFQGAIQLSTLAFLLLSDVFPSLICSLLRPLANADAVPAAAVPPVTHFANFGRMTD